MKKYTINKKGIENELVITINKKECLCGIIFLYLQYIKLSFLYATQD